MKRISLLLIFAFSISAGAAVDEWADKIVDAQFDREAFDSIAKCADSGLQGFSFPRVGLCPALDVGHLAKLLLSSDGRQAHYLVWKFYRVVHARFALVAYVVNETVGDSAKPLTYERITDEDQQDDLPTLLKITRKSVKEFTVEQVSLSADAHGGFRGDKPGSGFQFTLSH